MSDPLRRGAPTAAELAAAPPTPLALRAALGAFATGVTIISTRRDNGAPIGLTVNSFNSVSLEPALVLWSLARRSRSLEAFFSCRHYAVNVLDASQQALALRFASAVDERFAGVSWHEGLDGVPLIDGSVARFECLNRQHHEAGDHLIFVGEVVRCMHRPGAAPLVFHAGRFVAGLPGVHALESPSPAP